MLNTLRIYHDLRETMDAGAVDEDHCCIELYGKRVNRIGFGSQKPGACAQKINMTH